MHLDEGQVQELLHGEAAPPVAQALREHLSACADCVGRVAEAERQDGEVARLLRLVDHAPPKVDLRTMIARAPAPRAEWRRWAAGLMLAVGLAGAAYAATDTSFRRWIAAALETTGARAAKAPHAQPPALASGAGVSGIAVTPGRAFLILFTSEQREGKARLSLTDGPDVTVRTSIGAATFTSDIGRLLIENAGSSASVDIEIPRAAARVEIQVAGRRIFLVQRARVTTTAAPDSVEHYQLPLTAPRP